MFDTLSQKFLEVLAKAKIILVGNTAVCHQQIIVVRRDQHVIPGRGGWYCTSHPKITPHLRLLLVPLLPIFHKSLALEPLVVVKARKFLDLVSDNVQVVHFKHLHHNLPKRMPHENMIRHQLKFTPHSQCSRFTPKIFRVDFIVGASHLNFDVGPSGKD